MKTFKKSPVIFDEDSHTYQLEGRRLLGITGLIHSILGLGVYPDASEHVKDFVIPRAGSRGTAVHHAIQTYDELGIMQPIQTVKTKYGCAKRENLCYKDEVWDVSYELECYIHNLTASKALANELTVSDNLKWASQIDNVWEDEQTGGIWLVDTKTNNIELYPTCGYFQQDYFSSGEEALKEYLSWQLSIYAVLFEDENPGLKVEGLACNWLRKDTSAFWIIDRKPDELVRELLKTEYIFTESGPAYFHPDSSVFGIGAEVPVKREVARPILPVDAVSYFSDLLRTYKEAESKLNEAKQALRAAMEQHNVKSYDFGTFSASISADSVTNSFDSKRFQQENPELYKKYVTQKSKKGGIILKIKNND